MTEVLAPPVGEVVMFGGVTKEVAWTEGKLPPVGTKLYSAPYDANELAPVAVLRELTPAVEAYLMSGDPMAQNAKKRVWKPVLDKAYRCSLPSLAAPTVQVGKDLGLLRPEGAFVPDMNKSSDASLRALWVSPEDALMWGEYIVTDGERVTISQKAATDYGGFYWAVDELGSLDWNPTRCILLESAK